MGKDVHPLSLGGPLADTFVVRGLTGEEELGRLFDYTVELLATDEALAFGDVLGQHLTASLALPDGHRHFDGCITRFTQVGRVGRQALFHAQIRPWLWYLTRCSDCRIFQDRSVPEIVEGIFREHGYSDFENDLSESYEPREFCVQYRESDFAFVSRLLESEGIYYFFRHEDGKHVLVLADGYSAHGAPAGYETVPYLPPGSEAGRSRDHIHDWCLDQEIQTELYALRDYDFEKPRANLDAKESITRDQQGGSFEVYDYPGGYREKSRGDAVAKTRIEERQAGFGRVRPQANTRGLAVGCLFSLDGFPRDDQNREYLLTGMRCEARAGSYEGMGDSEPASFACTLTAADSQTPYRPARRTPQPVVQGPQTATVVGKSGEKIWTDKYGRVKVQFHWDREGARDENSSCWVRVSQSSAGKNWGSMFVPHIDQEVVVSFLEGDPDRPLITGRVYNADQMPPFSLPGNQHSSIIRDHYGNEIVLDGTPGNEHISLYSPSHRSKLLIGKSIQKSSESDDWQKTYGNARKLTVGHAVGITLGTNTSILGGNNFSLVAGGSELVKAGIDISVGVSARLGITIGPELALSLTTKVSAGWAREYKHTKGDYRRTSGSDIVHDSDASIVLAGGKGDHTILTSSDDEISLSYGDGGPRPRKDTWAKVFGAAAAATAVGAGAALITGGAGMASELENASSEDKDTNSADHNGEPVFSAPEDAMINPWSMGSAGVATLLGAASIGMLIAHIKSSSSLPVPSHTTESAKLSIKDEQVHMFAGKSSMSSVTVLPKEAKIMSDGDITLEATGDVVIGKLAKLSDSGGYMKIMKGKIDHKNLKVMG